MCDQQSGEHFGGIVTNLDLLLETVTTKVWLLLVSLLLLSLCSWWGNISQFIKTKSQLLSCYWSGVTNKVKRHIGLCTVGKIEQCAYANCELKTKPLFLLLSSTLYREFVKSIITFSVILSYQYMFNNKIFYCIIKPVLYIGHQFLTVSQFFNVGRLVWTVKWCMRYKLIFCIV